MTTRFITRPPSTLAMDSKKLATHIDKWLPRIYDAHSTLDETAIKGPLVRGGGFAVNTGAETVTGSKTGIASGLSSVSRVIASIDNGAVATNLTVTARVTPTDASKIDLYVWKPTAAGDTTPIAATSPVSVHWWVSGTASSV